MKKTTLFLIVAVVAFIVVAVIVSKEARAGLVDEGPKQPDDKGGNCGSGSNGSGSEFKYSYTRNGRTYKFTSEGIKKIQNRILTVYKSYQGSATNGSIYTTGLAMANSGGADGILGAKTKAAMDACTWETLLANSGCVESKHYVLA